MSTENQTLNSIVIVFGIFMLSTIASTNADNLNIQAQLMDIAAQEAQIANIGANKYMMLYGKNNPIPIINRWNSIEHRPALTDDQIAQINKLETQKQQLLKGASSN